jgi:hypothetical protein
MFVITSPSAMCMCARVSVWVQVTLLSVTQENAVDLQGMSSPLTLATTVGGKHTNPVKNMSLYHCMTFLPLVAIC